MAKKGELKPVDLDEQRIRDNPDFYNVVFFQPGSSTRVYQSFEKLDMALKYSEVTLQEPNRIRSAMIYAIDEYQNHALVGTMGRDLKWKPVVPKTY